MTATRHAAPLGDSGTAVHPWSTTGQSGEVIEMSEMLFPIMAIFTRILANRVAHRIVIGVSVMAVIAAVIVAIFGIAGSFGTTGHTPLADGMAWGF
jgi:hypothetical protein